MNRSGNGWNHKKMCPSYPRCATGGILQSKKSAQVWEMPRTAEKIKTFFKPPPTGWLGVLGCQNFKSLKFHEWSKGGGEEGRGRGREATRAKPGNQLVIYSEFGVFEPSCVVIIICVCFATGTPTPSSTE